MIKLNTKDFGVLKLRLGVLSVKAEPAMGKVVRELSVSGQTSARDIIRRGPPRTGRINPRTGKPRSAPGEPAKYDTGQLWQTISFSARGSEGEFGTGLDYGVYLELGTSKMEARPFLLPTAHRIQKIAGKVLLKHVRDMVKK